MARQFRASVNSSVRIRWIPWRERLIQGLRLQTGCATASILPHEDQSPGGTEVLLSETADMHTAGEAASLPADAVTPCRQSFIDQRRNLLTEQ